MNWNKGFEAQYYASIVDKDTWRDVGRFEITGGQISRAVGDLRESADIDCVRYNLGEQWIRIWLDARQYDSSEHIALFTGLATSPADTINGVYIQNSLECYSVLKPAQDILLAKGWYAPEGVMSGVILKDLLSITPAPLTVAENSPKLKQPIIAEQGETHLTMTEKILMAIDWRLKISGDGRINICPKAKDISGAYDHLENDAVEPQLTKEYDWYECPNVFRATSGDDSVVVKDDSSSPMSVTSRGREVWAEEESAYLSDLETLYDYAVRRLKESQQVAENVSYRRRYNPDIYPSDIVRLHYPAQGIDGDYIVKSQRITLGYGATTSEEVLR